MLKNIIRVYISKKQLLFAIQNPIPALRSIIWRCYLKMNKSKNQKLKAEITLLVSSGYFDPTFYLEKYPDVKEYRAGPVKHYYYHGYKEGRHPHANFNEVFYSSIYTTKRRSASS